VPASRLRLILPMHRVGEHLKRALDRDVDDAANCRRRIVLALRGPFGLADHVVRKIGARHEGLAVRQFDFRQAAPRAGLARRLLGSFGHDESLREKGDS
jgi:hypothetical protein